MMYYIKFRDENGNWYMDARWPHTWSDTRSDARLLHTRPYADKLAAMAEQRMSKLDAARGTWEPRSRVRVWEVRQ